MPSGQAKVIIVSSSHELPEAILESKNDSDGRDSKTASGFPL